MAWGLSLLLLLACDANNTTSEQMEQEVLVALNEGLLLHLPFDNNGDDVANKDHLTIINNCEFVADRNDNPESALSLNGLDGYIDILSPLPSQPEAFSISFWIKNLSLTSTSPYVLSLKEASFVDIRMNVYELVATMRYNINLGTDPRYSVRNELPANEWVHVTITYQKKSLIELFVDGALTDRVTDMNYSHFSEEEAGMSAIGCFNDPGDERAFWKGEIDDIRIYDRALSNEEIKALFEN